MKKIKPEYGIESDWGSVYIILMMWEDLLEEGTSDLNLCWWEGASSVEVIWFSDPSFWVFIIVSFGNPFLCPGFLISSKVFLWYSLISLFLDDFIKYLTMI